MIAGLIISAFLAGLFIFLWLDNSKQKRKRLSNIRSRWGKPKEESFYFPSIAKFSEAKADRGFHELSGQTINDLDLSQIFGFIDRTTSRIGQQVLYKRLIQPTDNISELKKSDEQATVFGEEPELRESLQLELLHLAKDDAYYVCTLLHKNLIERPSWFNLLYVDVAITISVLVASVFYPPLLILALIPFAINRTINVWNKMNTFQFSRSLTQLNEMINVVKSMLPKDRGHESSPVKDSINDLAAFQRKMRMIRFGSSGMKDELGQFAAYLFELIKALFLVEVIYFFLLTRELENKQSSIRTLFNYIGDIDVALSVASLRSGDRKTCRPEFTEPKKELTIVNAYHPLVAKCTTNDLSIRTKGILITGSNMSGKTTFLRTVMINSILAQTLYTCFADSFTTPVLKQFSSIRIDDSVIEGKSYYLAEVESMGSLIEQVDTGRQNLFVLDEVFKGTNTVERIAAAKAILSYLHRKNNLVIVSTHDIELSVMLSEEFDLYHFAEEIEDNQLFFDHKMKQGPLRTRNAIKILALAGYPADIIKEASLLSGQG